VAAIIARTEATIIAMTGNQAHPARLGFTLGLRLLNTALGTGRDDHTWREGERITSPKENR
jgi:hypothetical protein